MRYPAVTALMAGAVCAHAASYSTYIGDANPYRVSAIASDGYGNTLITGNREIVRASVFPFRFALTDVFVAKLDASGNLALLATFSGKDTDQANGIAVDPAGNIYIVGVTYSSDFPLRNPLQSTEFAGPFGAGSGFLIKLRADGTLIYSTYLGSTTGYSSLSAVTADAEGNAYVTGETAASDYPHTAGMPADRVWSGSIESVSGAFIAKIDPAGSRILYAGALTGPLHTCAGGSSCFMSPLYAAGNAIALDPAGNAYVAGSTSGGGLATTPGTLLSNGVGAFVCKVNSAGTGLVYATYRGPGNDKPGFGTEVADSVTAIAADGEGNAYLAGYTQDPAFPATAGAFQTSLAGTPSVPFVPFSDAFAAKLNPTGSAMVWATYLGGTGPDQAQTVSVDQGGNVWVSGSTQSTDFPTNASGFPIGSDFIAALDPSGSALIYSARFPDDTMGAAFALDARGMIHAGGATGLISAFPAGSAPGQTAGPWMYGVANAAGGVLSGRLAPGELFSIYGWHLGPAVPVTAGFDASGFLPTTLGNVQVMVNGIAAPLLYVSETQINVVAPVELTPGATAMQVALNGVYLLDFRVEIDRAAPEVFAVAINQDGTVNSQANPAKAGSYVSVWATGTGYFPASDGQMATDAAWFCSIDDYCQIVDDGGNPVEVSYIGAAPGTVNGVVQINFTVDSGFSGYYLSVDGISSDLFGIYATL